MDSTPSGPQRIILVRREASKHGIHPMPFQCCASVEDGGTTLKRHWVNATFDTESLSETVNTTHSRKMTASVVHGEPTLNQHWVIVFWLQEESECMVQRTLNTSTLCWFMLTSPNLVQVTIYRMLYSETYDIQLVR